jgi:hypothetical protein
MNSDGRYGYMLGILQGLQSLGRPASPSEIYRWLEEQGIANEYDLSTIQQDGYTRFRKEVRWARKELFDAGLIGAGVSGEWILTPDGQVARLTLDEARAMVRVRSRLRRLPAEPLDPTDDDGDDDVSGGPTTGPSPSDWSGVVTRSGTAPAQTYLVRFGERDLWKVGHAQDVSLRLRDLNRHVPHEVLGERWRQVLCQAWSTATLAYRMEQALLAELAPMRTTGERFACDEDHIRTLWGRIAG